MVDFELDAAQEAWLAQLRAFLTENVTPAVRSELAEHGQEMPDGEVAAFRRRIGERGWFGLNWPSEYGGLGLGAVYQHLLMREFEYWGVPGPDLTVTSVAPMIMRHGTEQNKLEFLPPISRGELICAVGYSEPEAGTDLANLRTRAVQDGDEWVITGSKIWNSVANRATHEWLCVRTDPAAPRHRGISVIMVPTDLPGIQIRPLYAWSGYRTNEAFFDEVRVPVGNLIGNSRKLQSTCDESGEAGRGCQREAQRDGMARLMRCTIWLAGIRRGDPVDERTSTDGFEFREGSPRR